MTEPLALIQPGPCRIRHIRPADAGQGGPVVLLGKNFYPDWLGLNGDGGFAGGSFESRLYEEGRATITFPNTNGADGALHRERFEIVKNGRLVQQGDSQLYKGGNYRPGDEWFEVYTEGKDTDPAFVGTPVAAKLTRGTVELSLVDAYWLLNKTRETAAGFWRGSPRDAFEHYSSVWQVAAGESFDTQVFSYSTSEQTSSDGKWKYQQASSQSGVLFIDMTDVLVPNGIWGADSTASVTGSSGSDPHTAWRVEARLRVTDTAPGSPALVGLREAAGGAARVRIRVWGDGRCEAHIKGATLDTSVDIYKLPDVRSVAHLAVECRANRWLYFFVNGILRSVLPLALLDGSLSMVPQVATVDELYLDSILWRRTRPFLMRGTDKGDYRLPGAPTPGGLVGEYIAGQDLKDKSYYRELILGPGRSGVRRQDATINFTAGDWQPAGLSNDYYGARWVGAVYLDFTAKDYRFRFTADDYARVWVGKTRFGEQVIDVTGATVNSVWLKAGNAGASPSGSSGPLAAQQSGWYPIIVEFADLAGAAVAKLEYERSDATGTWTVAGDAAVPFSPYGCYTADPRFDSHYELLAAIGRDFGYQWRCVPRQLEHPAFPGELVPRIREGRDTAKVLDELEARDPSSQIDASEVADSLLADAQGLGDTEGTLTAEVVNYGEATAHLFLLQEFESESDISVVELLLQRLDSKLRLRGGVWEELSADPLGRRELLDKFPLAGQLAEFAWAPGDAVRLCLPVLGVNDLTPRALLGVTWPFGPDGLGAPSVAFRQRRRSDAQTVKQVLRATLQEIRNYQGQLGPVQGSLGSTNLAEAPDGYSRVAMPSDLGKVVRAEVVVLTKADGSAKSIEVNGAAVVTGVTSPGRYDVTRAIATGGAATREMYAHMTGGTGAHTLQLELLVQF